MHARAALGYHPGVEPDTPPPEPKGLAEVMHARAERALTGLGRGLGPSLEGLGAQLGGARAALDAPAEADLAPLLPTADLPEVAADGPLGAIAIRLDREADLHRGVALRELARVAWTTRIAQAVAVVGFVVEVLIAAAATLRGLGGGAVEGRASLFVLAALITAGGAGFVLLAATRAREVHGRLADDAARRARAVEDRLFRVGIALERARAGGREREAALERLEDARVEPDRGAP